MKLNKLMRLLLPGLLSFSLASEACTTLAITDQKGDIFHGRTLEYSQESPYWMTYYPVGMSFVKKAPNGESGMQYSSKYAMLAITSTLTDISEKDVVEGMNSAGLSFSVNMINNADLATLPEEHYKDALPVTSLGEWALARFATVEEVAEAVKNGWFWSPTLSPTLSASGNQQAPFHYAFYDKKGGSIVVEASNGKLHVYGNPTRVMTNGPEFPWHLTNLNNYTHLINEDHTSNTLGNIKITQPDSGIAVAALPSSDTSVGRFVRGVYYTTYAQKVSTSSEAVNTLAHIMNRFDRPKNITVYKLDSESEKKSKTVSEFTVWTALSDLSRGELYVRTYNDINYSKYSLSQYKEMKEPVFKKIM
ncbi:linear amide C-N hydrolase [Mixta mediterraneensis]|uniref:linear amide C-N hydrolase n=1 Tax=Mixta mediterraneensis TaxID=2758443 RepID=UPI001875F60D|nr:linear amide C-N hydrolase [Mixta mediterraneensis]MBE5253476.1 linear amide C-N hydrolase [Mixta mediterraneensis]